MTITLHVHTKASRNVVQPLSATEFKIYVTTVPEHGKANSQVLKLLAKHLGVAKSQLEIISGEKNKTKVVRFDS